MMRAFLVVGLVALLGACVSRQIPEPPVNLAGTSWRLVYFQPFGGNPVVPPRVDRYTLDFGADGVLALGLEIGRAHV